EKSRRRCRSKSLFVSCHRGLCASVVLLSECIQRFEFMLQLSCFPVAGNQEQTEQDWQNNPGSLRTESAKDRDSNNEAKKYEVEDRTPPDEGNRAVLRREFPSIKLEAGAWRRIGRQCIGRPERPICTIDHERNHHH